jgi:hypothetical protein
VEGVTKYQVLENNVVIVIFDDEKTSPEKITDALSKENMPVQGDPVFLKLEVQGSRSKVQGERDKVQGSRPKDQDLEK